MGAGISRWHTRKQAQQNRAKAEVVPQYKFSTVALNRHFKVLGDDLSGAMRTVTKGKDSQQQLKVNFERIFETALRLDHHRLSGEDAKALTAALYVNLPKAIEACCSDAYEYASWSDVWEMRDWDFIGTQNVVATVVRAQLDPDYCAEARRTEPSVEEEDLAPVSFPILASMSEQVDAEVGKLANLWALVDTLQLGTEDRYLLDQIAARYLPDTWQMLEHYKVMPEGLRETATSMVLDQLQILTHQVADVQHRAASTSLDGLRAQTDFIREQRQLRQGSKLDLASKPS